MGNSSFHLTKTVCSSVVRPIAVCQFWSLSKRMKTDIENGKSSGVGQVSRPMTASFILSSLMMSGEFPCLYQFSIAGI